MSFTHDGESYTLWYWKGDYLNLGAGGECGIYKGDGEFKFVDSSLNPHMTIQLEYPDGTKSEVWEDDTWWITDFNPQQKSYNQDDVDNMKAYYTVELSFLTDDEWNDFVLENKEKGLTVIDPNKKIIGFNL